MRLSRSWPLLASLIVVTLLANSSTESCPRHYPCSTTKWLGPRAVGLLDVTTSVQGSSVRGCGCGKGIVVCSCMAYPLLLRTEGDLDHHQETPPWPSAITFDHHSTREGGGAMPAKRAYGMDQDLYPWSPIS